jgi:2'-hydroxyisoflavone reductase
MLKLGAYAFAATAVAGGRGASDGKEDSDLGGTGFLGPHLVERALARGHTVTLFNRGKTAADRFPEVEKIRGDRGLGPTTDLA